MDSRRDWFEAGEPDEGGDLSQLVDKNHPLQSIESRVHPFCGIEFTSKKIAHGLVADRFRWWGHQLIKFQFLDWLGDGPQLGAAADCLDDGKYLVIAKPVEALVEIRNNSAQHAELFGALDFLQVAVPESEDNLFRPAEAVRDGDHRHDLREVGVAGSAHE